MEDFPLTTPASSHGRSTNGAYPPLTGSYELKPQIEQLERATIVRALEASVKEVIKKCGFSISDIDLLIPHQANIRIIDHVIKKMGLPREKVYVNLQKYGNTSAASVPLALDEAVAEGRLNPGDLLVLSGFGAGLTYGANVIRW
jgi:3-oxoacyl-[acyl-carrier-protein] synthase-3